MTQEHERGGGQHPSSESAYSADLGDWRFASAGWLTHIDAKPVPSPTAIHQVTVYQPEGQDSLTFRTPSAAALHLNAAWRAASRAHEIKPSIVLKRQRGGGPTATEVANESTSVLFDYFEEMMACAFSSFGAVEAFCNQTIVEKAAGPLMSGKGKNKRLRTPEEVEREIGTAEKLCRLVPDLLGVPSPSGKAVWARFDKLRDLRDSVTHFKRRDQARKVISEPTALFRLYVTDPFTLPEAALDVIRYYFSSQQAPRWLQHPAWKRPDSSSVR